MRHRKKLNKMGLKKSHRNSLLKNLIASLVINGRLRTTHKRAQALSQRFARLMRLIQKKDKREAIRLIPQYCNINAASLKLVDELKEKYASRTSGFTRMTKIGLRKGDCASITQIELI